MESYLGTLSISTIIDSYESESKNVKLLFINEAYNCRNFTQYPFISDANCNYVITYGSNDIRNILLQSEKP